MPLVVPGAGNVEAGGPVRHHPRPSRRTHLLRAAGALVGVAVTWPVWLLVALAIWLEQPGPAFIVEDRLAGGGGEVPRLKFRTTSFEARSRTGGPPTLKVGVLLRLLRIDQLPHLVSLLALAVVLVWPAWLRPERVRGWVSGQIAVRRRHARRYLGLATVTASCAVLAVIVITNVVVPQQARHKRPAAGPTLAVPQAFDPSENAVLPHKRVVAFYGIPGSAVTGPAYTLDADMLERLRAQGAEYEKLDPAHPVALGIDVVASIADGDPGDTGTYSHRLDKATLDKYVDFCRTNNLLLFLDLNLGWSDPMQELQYFMPYLALPFVHLAIDPEWFFPRHNGVPGINLSNVRAADLNPVITAMAELPAKYRIPRKIVIMHQFRPTGDGLSDPYDPGSAEIADKRNMVDDPRVDVVWHVDSVGGWFGDIQDKTRQYSSWVRKDMERFNNFKYGGFKIFYQLESKNRLMTPKEVMTMLKPPPMVVTYGN
nr:sugar transferase [Planosporangium thailandense]